MIRTKNCIAFIYAYFEVSSFEDIGFVACNSEPDGLISWYIKFKIFIFKLA